MQRLPLFFRLLGFRDGLSGVMSDKYPCVVKSLPGVRHNTLKSIQGLAAMQMSPHTVSCLMLTCIFLCVLNIDLHLLTCLPYLKVTRILLQVVLKGKTKSNDK